LIKITPTPLLKDGRTLEAAMKHVRITKDEIGTAARQQGMGGPDKVAAVVLETDGSLSVIPIEKLSSGLALEGVSGA